MSGDTYNYNQPLSHSFLKAIFPQSQENIGEIKPSTISNKLTPSDIVDSMNIETRSHDPHGQRASGIVVNPQAQGYFHLTVLKGVYWPVSHRHPWLDSSNAKKHNICLLHGWTGFSILVSCI